MRQSQQTILSKTAKEAPSIKKENMDSTFNRDDDSQFDQMDTSYSNLKMQFKDKSLDKTLNERGSSITASQMNAAFFEKTQVKEDDLSDSDEIEVKSIHNVEQPDNSKTLDPIPHTTAGQARFLFYEADGAQA